MEEMVFQIGPIRPPSEANSLLLRVTINCPWNKCKFCMLYKKYDFHTRPVEDVKKDIDTMAELRDRILQYKKDGDWDIEAINKDYQTLTTDDQRWCYHMVFRWKKYDLHLRQDVYGNHIFYITYRICIYSKGS